VGDDDLIRGPKWRTRTDPRRRARAAVGTLLVVASIGAALMALTMWPLSAIGAPGWVVLLPWWLPTLGVMVWTLRGPAPAIATDDDDDSWAIYAIRYVLVGADTPRPTPVRLIAAVLVGAPVCWALLLLGILTVAGLF
jgi:hypothetical protein